MVEDLKTLDEETLYSIYNKCDWGYWPDEIGEKPDDFDNLPAKRKKWQFWIRRTKSDYLIPIGAAAYSLIPDDFIERKRQEEHKKAEKQIYDEMDCPDKISFLAAGKGIFTSKPEMKALSEYFSRHQEQ